MKKSLALRQNIRDNLSNEKTKSLFILSFKKLSESIEICYSQHLSNETHV